MDDDNLETGDRYADFDEQFSKAEQPKPKAKANGTGDAPAGRTEQAVMREFVDEQKDRLRYDHDRGRWLVWNGHYWRPDAKKMAFWSALEFCHRLGRSKAERAAFANAVETMARAHPAVSTCAADWNPATDLVACPTGVIELATGTLRPGRPADMIDRCLAVSPDPQCDGTAFFTFMDTMFAGNSAITDCLQRWFGYCLSGDVSEHKFLFLHGTGANGKGTLLNTISSIWGDLVATAPIDVFLESAVDRHTTEIARLHGTHLVVVHETREGRRWDEAKIKSMTGGDKLTARFMRRDDFEFFPRFKPVFAGNHEPHLRSVDEAIRRRLVLLPCTVTIPPDQRDPKLGQKLWDIAPRILAWAVEGYRHWQRVGINPPDAMRLATDDYLANQDDLEMWITERCATHAGAGPTKAIVLFSSWEAWKFARSDKPGSARAFNAKLKNKGFIRRITKEGIVFDGIRLS